MQIRAAQAHLIAFGETVEAGAAHPTPPGSLGAQSLVASGVTNLVSSRLEKLAGLSQLSIDPVLGGTQQSAGARIALRLRVTSKLFVTFATDVTSTPAASHQRRISGKPQDVVHPGSRPEWRLLVRNPLPQALVIIAGIGIGKAARGCTENCAILNLRLISHGSVRCGSQSMALRVPASFVLP